ncbi:MAG: response regulator [Chloroflexota bacterium]
MAPIKILLVDDHVLFRKGLASLLASRGMEIAGEASNGMEGVERARQLAPDLILMDIRMPVVDGLGATRQIKRDLPEAKVIMLTVSDDDADLFEAIKAGANGYLLKNMDPNELFELLEGTVRGEAPISRVMASRILTEFANQTRRDACPPPMHTTLTPRETEVLQLVAEGTSNREIANTLCISENTVKNHLRNILEKLHLENRVQAVAYALRQGLIQDPAPTRSASGG